jgi:hypothetical protein
MKKTTFNQLKIGEKFSSRFIGITTYPLIKISEHEAKDTKTGDIYFAQDHSTVYKIEQ